MISVLVNGELSLRFRVLGQFRRTYLHSRKRWRSAEGVATETQLVSKGDQVGYLIPFTTGRCA